MKGDARHVETIVVRWGDLDSLQHVNQAKYFTYCETAHMSYFEALHFNDYRLSTFHGPVVAAIMLNFRQQVQYPAKLEVEARVSEIGRTSFRMEYEIYLYGMSDRVAEGRSTIVWIDYETGRSTPLPEALKEKIFLFEGME